MTIAALAAALLLSAGAQAQTPPTSDATPTPDTAVMLTIFFKHDQSRPLGELNAQLERQASTRRFRPRVSRSSAGT
ncbi:hypothetical protein ACVMDN_007388 [Bradyrhizobium sp. USDA 4510]